MIIYSVASVVASAFRRKRVPGRAIVCLAALLALVPAGPAAQQPPPQRATGTIEGGVRAVLVDVVVRDRRGEPVRDLTEADFEVVEDGVPQAVTSFNPVFDADRATAAARASAPASTASPSATPAVGGPAAINPGPPVIALVFDRLTPEARRLATQAARAYVGDDAEAPAYIGVFGIDLAMTPYVPFTRNGHVLRKTLDELARRGSASFNNAEQAEQRAAANQQAAGAAAAAAAAQAGAGAGNSGGTAAGDAQLAQMQAQMITDFEVMARDQQGYSTTNGLFAVIKGLRPLPGRKSLVLFSEGLAIPPAVQRLFLGVIDAANRSNVSIYTMDAAGLRAESEQAAIRDQVNAAAGTAINTGYADGGGSEPLSRMLEKNEDVLRQDAHTGLGALAQQTGGLLIENSNNLRAGFDRIENDLRNYYLLGYTPTNETFDGKFRTIDVRVKRSGVTVAARKGYFAVKDTGGVPISEWEAPALAALEGASVPNDFPIRVAALSFPEPDRTGLIPVVVDVPTAGVSFTPDSDGKSYSSDFAVLVRFLDANNDVARKVSQHYQITGPIDQLARARLGNVIFYREPELKPGLYSMETIVYDAPSGKSSARLSSVTVPEVSPDTLRVSSLMLVRQAEKVPENDRRSDNPLLAGDLLLYPNLGEPVSKAAREVGFYFTAYPAKGPAPEALLELALNGSPVARVPLTLGASDATGRIQQVGRLPLDQLAPGTYELRIAVKQGATEIVRSTLLRITE